LTSTSSRVPSAYAASTILSWVLRSGDIARHKTDAGSRRLGLAPRDGGVLSLRQISVRNVETTLRQRDYDAATDAAIATGDECDRFHDENPCCPI